MGGRVSLIRYGTPNAYRPEGWEVQIEAAAMPRIWPNRFSAPLISCDYRVGVPWYMPKGKWQFKTGYYHVSAHLGDEYMLLNPAGRPHQLHARLLDAGRGLLLYRQSAVVRRDRLRLWRRRRSRALGVSIRSSTTVPAVRGGAPFAAFYGDLRQELNYGGFFVVQAGWQWRGGAAMKTFRLGLEYINGASTQYEFYNLFEQQTGFGIWYDY